MRWRRRAAVAVLGVGWLIWLTNIDDQTPAKDPKYLSTPAKYDAELRRLARADQYPTRGVIGYRDELFPDADETRSRRNQYYLLFQYILAPVLLDREGRHDVTFVLSKTDLHLEPPRSTP